MVFSNGCQIFEEKKNKSNIQRATQENVSASQLVLGGLYSPKGMREKLRGWVGHFHLKHFIADVLELKLKFWS